MLVTVLNQIVVGDPRAVFEIDFVIIDADNGMWYIRRQAIV